MLYSPSVSEPFINNLKESYRIRLPEKIWHRTFGSWWRSWGVSDAIAQEHTTIFHGLSNEIPFGINRARTKTVVTIHDLLFLEYPEHYPSFDRKIYEAKTRYAGKQADKVITVSEETKRDLIIRYRVPAEKIEVVYPIVSIPSTAQPIHVPSPYILNVGSLVARKNQKRLIEAYALIEKNVQEELWIVGSGPLKQELGQLINQLKLGARVKVITGLHNQVLAALYKNATAFIYPSLKEGFGMPIVEALLSEIPVVASAGGAIEEAAGPGSLFCDPQSSPEIAQQITRVLNDKRLRQEMISSGVIHAQKMNSKNLSEQLMAVYNSML
ncbi:MAG: glycosyltransferase family 4 protein [Bacteroidetes bacterium]|nr:glycosyltransferase family 4 protein [Bacteroidota bacterium]